MSVPHCQLSLWALYLLGWQSGGHLLQSCILQIPHWEQQLS